MFDIRTMLNSLFPLPILVSCCHGFRKEISKNQQTAD